MVGQVDNRNSGWFFIRGGSPIQDTEQRARNKQTSPFYGIYISFIAQ